MHSRGLLSNASYSSNRMGKKIGNIILVSRTSEYARGKSPEPAGPSLKARGEMKAVSISQKRSCHGNSQWIGATWFIADAVRNNDGRISSRSGIYFPNHVVPCVSRCGRLG